MPTAIITGGAVRLGKALACRLIDRGWALALHHNSSDPAEVVAHARHKGVACTLYPGDLRDPAQAEALVARVTAECDDVALLVNCAANFIHQNVEQTSTDTLTETLNLNLAAPYLLMREYKRRVNRGLIVNILDERITKHIPAFAAYSVSKVALAHLTRLAAVEWGATVRVNGIAPGLILPPAGQGEDYLTRNARNIPTQTHGTVEDIARGLDYLLDSPFVNGEILFIDGGESCGRTRAET